MKMLHTPSLARRHAQRLLLSLLACCVLVSILVAQAIGSTGQVDWTPLAAQTDAAGGAAATVEQCVTTGEQTDRSATFSAEMTAVTGTARMAMRIEVQERLPGEELFHTVSAPGLGVWRGSAPGVKIYQYVKQVTNLSAPAGYRALVRFHWLNDKGYVIKRAERHTLECVQPASVTAPAPVTPATPGGSTAGSTAPSTTTG
jgi:4-amino-4-deoxy-L-arabinose transferase-like glycosyltransferase